MNSFRSIGPSKSTGFYDVPECLDEALVPAFLGIAVSLFAIAIWRSLMSQVEIFDLEMENVSVGPLNILTPHVAKLSTFRKEQ